MVVYVEYVFIDNLVIDYLLLKLTLQVLGVKPKKARLFLCALLGAGFALLMPVFTFNNIALIFYKCFSGIIIFCLSIKKPNKKELYRGIIIFFLLTFLTGGAIIGIFSLFNVDYNKELSIALMIAPVYLLIKAFESVIKYLYKRREVEVNCYKTVISLGGKSIECKGFVDTGNMLFDGDVPVIIVSKSTGVSLIGNSVPKIKYIDYQTTSNKDKMLTVQNATVEIYLGDKPSKIDNVRVGVSKVNIGAEYNVILHPYVLKEINDEVNRESKKVS